MKFMRGLRHVRQLRQKAIGIHPKMIMEEFEN